MLQWIRVIYFGDRQSERKVRQTIEKMWPLLEAHIEIVGSQGTVVSIRIWNDNEMDIRDIAHPEDFHMSDAGDGAFFAPVISKLAQHLPVLA